MRLAVRVAAVFAVALLLPACAPSRVATTWVEPGRRPTPYDDLVVFGVAANETVRGAYEDGFTRALRDQGARARPGSGLLPAGGLGRTDSVVKAVGLSGADAVIVTHLIGERAEATDSTAPPASYVVPGSYRNLSPYYERVYEEVTDPGYYASFRSLRLETHLYDARRGALVWSSRSRVLDPSSEQTTISEIITAVTAEMARAGFLPSRRRDSASQQTIEKPGLL